MSNFYSFYFQCFYSKAFVSQIFSRVFLPLSPFFFSNSFKILLFDVNDHHNYSSSVLLLCEIFSIFFFNFINGPHTCSNFSSVSQVKIKNNMKFYKRGVEGNPSKRSRIHSKSIKFLLNSVFAFNIF